MPAKRRQVGEALHVIANLLVVLAFLFPLIWMLAGAFKAEADLLSPRVAWFFEPTLDHWRYIFANWNVETHLTNSLVIASLTTLLTLALGLPAAFALSRFPIWRKDAVVFDILSLKMIPPIAAAVPTFLLAQRVGLYNSYTVLVLLNTAFQLPFVILVMKSFIDEIPRDLDEAAEIDGCGGAIDRFLTVTWPLLGPTTMFVLVTTSITAFKVFDTVVTLTRGGPMGSTEVILYAIYLEGFQYFNSAYASALTLVFLVFILIFSVLQTFILARRVHY